MKFQYIGEYPAGSSITAYGSYVFTPGASVELPERFAAKARNNQFFVAVEGEKALKIVARSEPEAEDLPEFTKTELIDMAEKAGVKFDKRWAAEKIKQAINDAANELS